MPKPIMLISDHPDDATFLAGVTSVINSELRVVPSAEEGVEQLSVEDFEAIFVDISDPKRFRQFEYEAQKRFGLFQEQIQPNSIHFIGANDLHENRDAILSPLFGNFCQRVSENLVESGQFYGRFIQANSKKTEVITRFLTEKIKVQTVILENTKQKQEAAEAVRGYLVAAKIPNRISNIITNSVDELLMNALFDAPCDQFGKSLYSATARNQARELVNKEKTKMSIGFDGFYVAVSVTDFFGSLDRNRLLSHVSAQYRDRDYHVRQGQAGAGLGIASIYHSGGTLVYDCETKVKTDATLLYRAYSNYVEFKNQFKFFSAKFHV